MQKINKILSSGVTIGITLLIGFFNAALNYSLRYGYVFIDNEVFSGFSLALFCIFVCIVISSFIMLIINLKKITLKDKIISQTLAYRISVLISILFSFLFLLINTVNLLIDTENFQATLIMLKQILPKAALILLILSLIFIFPMLKAKKIRIITVTVIIASVTFSAIGAIFPLNPYKFTSKAAVFDNGTGYSVVFSTNDIGTGYIEYAYEGKNYKVYDEDNGKKRGNSKIHTLKIPYEHLINNSYRLGSVRVIDELSYGGRLGKEIKSEEYNFKIPSEAEILTVSDWHTHMKTAKKSIANLGAYNAVIMLGDSSNALMFEEEIIENLIKFGGDLTNGAMPIIFIRGNHEARGRAAVNLSRYLGMDNFYYQTKLGGYNFVVLDSGEDKQDSHSEYGGMNDFAENRSDMIDWLLKIPNDSGKNIILSHDIKICLEEELSEKAYGKFNEMNSSLVIGGHNHYSKLDSLKGINTYRDGGYSDKKYIASKITLKSASIHITAADNKGEIIFDNEIGI